MSLFCANCFHDNELKKWINSLGHNNYNVCSFCGEPRAACIDSLEYADKLSDKFEFLINCVIEDDNGELLYELLQKYCAFFNEKITNIELFISELFGQSFNQKRFKIKIDATSYADKWRDFSNEIKELNRFFPINSMFVQSEETGVFLQLLEQLSKDYSAHQLFYRARVSEAKLLKNNMRAPPKDKAIGGRANPVGISYLYLSENENTCIAEVRPSNGCTVYVSTFSLKERIKLLDLTSPIKDSSILAFDEDSFIIALKYMQLLDKLSLELSKPILPSRSDIDYIPTQYLCEYIKSIGFYDGIIFNSSVAEGKNFVIFNQDIFKNNNPKKFIIKSTHYSYN